MLMKQNVNNDVTTDSPIVTPMFTLSCLHSPEVTVSRSKSTDEIYFLYKVASNGLKLL